MVVYGWVAQKKLAGLTPCRNGTEADGGFGLRARLENRSAQADLGPAEQSCVDALRFEQFGDLPAARDHWEAIRDKYLKYSMSAAGRFLRPSTPGKLKPSPSTARRKEREFR